MQQDSDRAAFWLIKKINQAIREYSMIEDGDRVAVALSGGKDSLSLLRLLDLRRKWAPEHYSLAVIHVVGDARGPETPAHLELVEWIRAQTYESRIVPVAVAPGEQLPMGCQRCTWNRRKALFQAAQEMECNVIAFGHHADDLAETTLLNLLNNGKVETMAPIRRYFDGSMRIIRPLCFTSENEVRRFARVNPFPTPPPDCPQSSQSRRKVAKEIVRLAQHSCQNARTNLLRAGLRGNVAWEDPDQVSETTPGSL